MLPSERATEVVNQRQGQYGHPGPIYKRWIDMVNLIEGTHIPHEHGALLLILLKIAREYSNPYEDNITDIAGYANVYEMVKEYLHG